VEQKFEKEIKKIFFFFVAKQPPGTGKKKACTRDAGL
jgi:hypothetical protein